MPDPVFVSSLPFEPERVHAAAIYCSDGRFGDQVDDFLHHHLGLPNYDRLTVPGGPAWLGFRSDRLGQYALIRDQLDFLVQVHRLERVVLIGHYGCAYYLRDGGDPESMLPVQLQEIRDAAGVVQAWFAGLQVDTFLARAGDERVHFVPVPLR